MDEDEKDESAEGVGPEGATDEGAREESDAADAGRSSGNAAPDAAPDAAAAEQDDEPDEEPEAEPKPPQPMRFWREPGGADPQGTKPIIALPEGAVGRELKAWQDRLKAARPPPKVARPAERAPTGPGAPGAPGRDATRPGIPSPKRRDPGGSRPGIGSPAVKGPAPLASGGPKPGGLAAMRGPSAERVATATLTGIAPPPPTDPTSIPDLTIKPAATPVGRAAPPGASPAAKGAKQAKARTLPPPTPPEALAYKPKRTIMGPPPPPGSAAPPSGSFERSATETIAYEGGSKSSRPPPPPPRKKSSSPPPPPPSRKPPSLERLMTATLTGVAPPSVPAPPAVPIEAQRDLSDQPTILIVGVGEPLEEAVRAALFARGLHVESSTRSEVTEAVTAAAPDLVLLLGDAAQDGGNMVLRQLSASSLTSVVPCALLASDPSLDERLSAFRHGAVAVVERTASVDAIAKRVESLAREIPERTGESVGEVAEATLEELVAALSKQLRTGILSVHGVGGPKSPPLRLVLSSGRALAEAVEEFVRRINPLVTRAEPVVYEFHEHAGGTIELLGSEDTTMEADVRRIAGLRLVLVGEDPSRADVLADELRRVGVKVVVVDVKGRGLERARELDPDVILIDEASVRGDAFELVRDVRGDARLRWASLLVVATDELWPKTRSSPLLPKLVEKLGPLTLPARTIRERVQSGQPFDTRLEALGPARLLRVITSCSGTRRIVIQGPRAVAHVDVSNDLIAGASVQPKNNTKKLEGYTALAALLGLANGRVRIESVRLLEAANIMAPIDEALGLASAEPAPIAPSTPPPSMDTVPGVRVPALDGIPAYPAEEAPTLTDTIGGHPEVDALFDEGPTGMIGAARSPLVGEPDDDDDDMGRPLESEETHVLPPRSGPPVEVPGIFAPPPVSSVGARQLGAPLEPTVPMKLPIAKLAQRVVKVELPRLLSDWRIAAGAIGGVALLIMLVAVAIASWSAEPAPSPPLARPPAVVPPRVVPPVPPPAVAQPDQSLRPCQARDAQRFPRNARRRRAMVMRTLGDARAAVAAGNHVVAQQKYCTLLMADRRNAAAAAGLAESLLARGDVPLATAWARQAVLNAPRIATFHTTLANALDRGGDRAGAAREREEAQRLERRNDAAATRRAAAQRRARERRERLERLRRQRSTKRTTATTTPTRPRTR